MNFRKKALNLLRDRGIEIELPIILDLASWDEIDSSDLSIPRSFSELRILAKDLFRKDLGRVAQPKLDCLEESFNNFLKGFANPNRTEEERLLIEREIDARMPSFENVMEKEHFTLKWTNSSEDLSDNIEGSSLISETAEYLEAAWTMYTEVFDKEPYKPDGRSTIEVLFHDIPGYGLASPPDGPIQLDSVSWNDRPGIRQPTSVHELFHKLQYSFGYRTLWEPNGSIGWFNEGTAAWAEVFVGQSVSLQDKVTSLFGNPGKSLFNSGSSALPFWIFFHLRHLDIRIDHPLEAFLSKYEQVGNQVKALKEFLAESWPDESPNREIDGFYSLFCQERLSSTWNEGRNHGLSYPSIRGPDGISIDPDLAVTDLLLTSGSSFSHPGFVTRYGTDYYKFGLHPNTNGAELKLKVAGEEFGDYRFTKVYQKERAIKKVVESPEASELDDSEYINTEFSDSITIVVSGRNVGGAYSISVSID